MADGIDHEAILATVGKFTAGLITDLPEKTAAATANVIAAALVYSASEIWKTLGGPKMAAQQLYAAADRCVDPSKK